MNKRIRELEAQCWEPKQYGPSWFDSEKFAQLIVKECARDFDNTYMAGGNTMGNYIRQKFGVEL